MPQKLTETTLTEQPTIDWLKELGYEYQFGPDISPGGLFLERDDFREVVLKKRLKKALQKINPQFSEKIINDAVEQVIRVEHPNLEIANKMFYEMLNRGVVVEVKKENGETRGDFVKLVDFENPENNDFLVVNQFVIQGLEGVRRPDVIVFLNGIPIAVFELKNPVSEDATIQTAYKQVMQEYKKDIPDLFKYNQIIVVSDLLEAKQGTVSSAWEWFLVWKGIEDEDEKNEGISQLEVLVKGIFHKMRLLDILENFIVFEGEGDKFVKKMPLYHQYFGVNKAVEATKRATASGGNKKIGVFWHAQGSGKSLSMVFYVNKVRKLKQLQNPTFVFLTDRNDLDSQLFKTFKRSGYDLLAKQAEAIEDLKEKLRTAGGELIFTTIQKFQAEKGERYPLLTERENIIVLADEAHRSEYAILAGDARQSMPNASFIGFTGTPISLRNRDTRLVFGEYISIYPINKAVEDGATVRIYYEGRLVPLHLTNEFIDEEFDYLTAEYEVEAKEELKKRFSRLEKLISDEKRLKQIADDIVWHFSNRGLEGKAMVVTISRKVAVRMYQLLASHFKPEEIAVVISNLKEFRGKIQENLNIKDLDGRFKDPDDPLKIVVVCDMWLTGFDVWPLHTMYIDKPMKNHTLIQAIARVNRVFKDKNGGLIVDYIGIADDLRKSLSIYSQKDVKDALVPIEDVINKMLEKYDIVKSYFEGVDYSGWKKLPETELARLIQKSINQVITDKRTGKLDEEKQKRFIKEATVLFQLFALVCPHREANNIRDDVEFFQAIKRNIIKRLSTGIREIEGELESAVKELISKSIAVEGIIDLFAAKDKEKPEISIFDDKFLEQLRKMEYKNLTIQILKKLLNDEIRIRTRKNIIRFKSLKERLEKIIEEYENGFIKSAEIIERLIELAKEIKRQERAGEAMGLTEEELAFYDSISNGKKYIKNNEELKATVKELIKIIKRDLTVDWANHDVIKARIRANVRTTLLRKGLPVKATESILDMLMQQAMFLFRDYVPSYI